MDVMSSASVAPVGPGAPGPAAWAPIGELVLPYDPTTLAETVRRRRRRFVVRVISLGISLAILGGILAWQWDAIKAQGGAYWVFLGIVTMLVGGLIAWLGLRRSPRSPGRPR